MSQTKAQLIDTLVASLLPASDSSVDLGSNAVRFANIYGDTLYGSGANLTGLNIVTDTSPQLGGNLASNGNNINMADNDEIVIGSSNDLILRHIPGSRHEILGAASASLQVRCDNQQFLSENGNEYLFKAIKDGAVELYYDASLKISTSAAGAVIQNGHLILNRQDTSNEGGELVFNRSSDNAHQWFNDVYGADTSARLRWHNGGVEYLSLTPNSELTAKAGLDIKIASDTGKFIAGTGSDLQIYHDGSHSYALNTTGNFFLGSNNSVDIGDGDFTEYAARFKHDDAVELYYDNSKKFETTSDGAKVTGKLGVGVASPTSELEVQGSAHTNLRVLSGDNSNIGFFQAVAGQDLRIGTSTNSPLHLFVNGVNRVNIDTTGYVSIPHDSTFLQIGAGQDLDLHHNGTNSFIRNKTGNLHIRPLVAEEGIILFPNGAVEIYYDNSKKFETESDGARTQGRHLIKGHSDIDNQGSPLLFLQDSTNTNTKAVFLLEDDYTSGRGALAINVGESGVTNDRDLILQKAGGKVGVRCTPTESFEVSGTSKFNGAIKLGDNNNLKFGAGEDLLIYHASSDDDSYIKEAGTGRLQIWTSSLHVKNQAGDEVSLVTNENGNCELWFDNSKKLETTNSGIMVSGKIGVGASAANNSINTISAQGNAQTTLFYGFGTIDLTSASDERVKNNVVPTSKGLDDILKLPIVDFTYKPEYAADSTTVRTGGIAQEWQKVDPNLVNAENEDLLFIEYKRVIPHLIKAIQELSDKVAALEAA